MADKKYLAAVAALGCLICERPAAIHHIRTGQGMSQRAGPRDVLPLCGDHHQNGGYGVAIHAGQEEWERLHGTELELVEQVRQLVGMP